MDHKKRIYKSAMGQSGFSILETLVASVILVVALIGFLSVAVSTTNLGGRNSNLATANALIYDKYESFKFMDLGLIADSVEQNIDIDSTGALIQGVFDRTVTVSQIDAGTSLLVAKNVNITVSWPGHSVTQSSIFMKE